MRKPIAKLEILKGEKPIEDFQLTHTVVTLGRSPDNVLPLQGDPNISRHHARLSQTPQGYILIDLGSSAGTTVNGVKLTPHTPHSLKSGALIGIGTFQLRFQIPAQSSSQPLQQHFADDETVAISALEFPLTGTSVQSQGLSLRDHETLSIGRDPLNDIVINHPSTSRFHAQIKKRQGSYEIFDLGSTNSTFVNGKSFIGKRVLRAGDTIRIGPSTLVIDVDETLIETNEEGNLGIDAIHLNKQIGKGVNLLNNISLSIQPREFVAIAGVSGGGKSTLLDALNGFRPATSGAVLVNGTDLYKNFNAYRTEIGYVPQRDIVHMELTVHQALDFAAQLRMPADTTRAERKIRIDEVLKDLGLSHRHNIPVKALSGGQIKRVSIGVELLTKPSLFFLDEATSGLDPGTEADLMQLLRQLADQGRTILLITHATENVTQCDQVVFMARGGNLAYFGPPQGATQYFGVQRFNQIYDKVERELTPEQWQQRYLQSSSHQKYVAARQQDLSQVGGQGRSQRLRQPAPGAEVKRVSSWQQFWVLSQRNLTILLHDRASLILMLAVAPILGLLDFFAWQHNLFNVQTGNARLALTMLFTTGLIAVMVGVLATMREIVKEQDIYRRERVIGLQILPYILSKVWVSVLLAMYQAAIFLGFKLLAVDIPRSTNVVVGMYITLVLATLAGMIMGLLASAIAPNQNVAPLIAIIFLVPQIIFGGGVLPVDTFGPPGQLINRISLTKWPFEALVTLTGLGQDVARDPCWALPETEREQLNQDDKKDCPCLGSSIFNTCKFPGIREAYKPAVDEPEPLKPKDPGDPPPQSSQANPSQYQADVATYLEEVTAYRKALDQWQQEYSDWKEQNEGAIGKAEGMINQFYRDYGETFKVNVIHHWLIMCLSSAVMLALIFVVQKRKDIV